MANSDLIKQAIQSKKPISATYDGFYREMCPHILGIKNGRMQCLFYQYGGNSKSGLSPIEAKNWRCIPVDSMTDVRIIEGSWHTASNHSRPQSCVDTVITECDF